VIKELLGKNILNIHFLDHLEILENIRNLQNLYLESNNLSGVIPASLSYLKNLKNINLSSNDNLQGALPPMEFVTVCDFKGTGLCLPKGINVKCKAALNVCTEDEEKNTGILRNRQKMKKIEEEEEELNEDDIHGKKNEFGLSNFVLPLILGFIIAALLLFFILKKYIKYRYDVKLQKNMGQRPYFINHSLEKYRNSTSSSTNHPDDNHPDDIQITSNRLELEAAASQLSNNVANSQDNYRPIYPDTLNDNPPQSDIFMSNSQYATPVMSPQIIQVPAMAHSPQSRSVISSQLLNGGDYIVVDQSASVDNLMNYNTNRSSLIINNSASLHANRSHINRPRSHSNGHSPVVAGLTPYNPTNRYSIGNVLYNS